MARIPGFPQLEASLGALEGLGVVPSVGQAMRVGTGVIQRSVFEHILDEVQAYTDSGNPDILPELRSHLDLHIDTTCALLAGDEAGDFDFVRRHAHRRAEQKFPLDALLHAYRVLHKLFSRWIRDAALDAAPQTAHVRRVVAAVTDFTIEYTGAIGTLVTSEYVRQTRLLAEAEGDRRTELLNMLLSGFDESDNRAAQILRASGYLAQRQSYCVAVAQSVNPGEMESPARAQRMADAITQALRDTPVRTLVGVRDNHVIAVVSATRRQSGWTAPQSITAERVYPALRMVGPAALIGLSSDAPSTSHIPRALREARVAFEFASVSDRVKRYTEIPLQQMLVSVARDNLRSAMPAWYDAFDAANRKSKGALHDMLAAYADNDMNVQKTAKALAIHPNTIYARVQRISELTGKNVLEFHALNELLLASELAGPS